MVPVSHTPQASGGFCHRNDSVRYRILIFLAFTCFAFNSSVVPYAWDQYSHGHLLTSFTNQQSCCRVPGPNNAGSFFFPNKVSVFFYVMVNWWATEEHNVECTNTHTKIFNFKYRSHALENTLELGNEWVKISMCFSVYKHVIWPSVIFHTHSHTKPVLEAYKKHFFFLNFTILFKENRKSKHRLATRHNWL